MKTSELFKKEIGYISNELLRGIVAATLDAAPEYIQTIPASSSGKYHPKAELGEGGLVRHIRAVTGIAYSLMQSNVFRDMIGYHYDLVSYQDSALAACILHDCMKCDDSPEHCTVFDHPLKAADLFKTIALRFKKNKGYPYLMIETIYNCIASHMGKWSTNSDVKLPEPISGIANFVHMCDYIASRRFIDFNFEVYDNAP